VVVGGGDSAVDWVLMLEPVAASVAIVHRRDEFRAHAHSVRQMASTRVRVITNAEISAVRGEPHLAEVAVQVRGSDVPEWIACDRLVAALGFTANLGPLLDWGFTIDKRSIVTDSSGATNLPGVYAAGDIVEYPGKVRLIATGFGEAATAVNNAFVYLHPGRSAFPGHLSEHPPEAILASVGV
jgi:thioredoxin reductase